MGKALRGAAEYGGSGGPPAARGVARLAARGVAVATRALVRTGAALALVAAFAWPAPLGAQQPAERLDAGRFTVVAHPPDLTLARSMLADVVRRDSFPGLPRPRARVVIAVAGDREEFRRLVGPGAPEWGAAIAFPASQRIVMQGSRAGSDAGDPFPTLRHELAHLALHEAMGDLPPRWFDEGYASYAAGEWSRDEYFATNLALAWGGMPGLNRLDEWFEGGGRDAEAAYALSHRAVAELAELDTARGLTLFFRYWKEEGRMDAAVRRAYGLTLPRFEERWQSQTRRRYGALALVADVTLATAVLLVPLIPLWIARRRRDRARLAAMRAADALEERRERESALAALLAGGTDEGPVVSELSRPVPGSEPDGSGEGGGRRAED